MEGFILVSNVEIGETWNGSSRARNDFPAKLKDDSWESERTEISHFTNLNDRQILHLSLSVSP